MAAATEPCRVLVVDDQDAFRAAAAAVVAETAGFEMCGESDSCSGVQGLVARLSLDVATVLRRERPEVVVVLVSAFSRDDVPAEVLGQGIGFLAKEDLAPATLQQAVAGLCRRRTAP